MTKPALKGKLIGQGNTAEVFEWGNQDVLKLYRSGLPEDLCINEFEITKYVYERLAGKTMLRVLISKQWSLRK